MSGPHMEPKNSPVGPKKVQNDPIKGNKENKVIALYEKTPKQFFNPTQTPKIAQ